MNTLKLGIPIKIGNDTFPFITPQDLCKHAVIIGATGKGKTVYLLNLIKELTGYSLIILDPNGDLAPKVAGMVDKDRLIWVDKKHPLSFNPFSRGYIDKSELSNELVEAINSSVSSFNPDQFGVSVRMSRILRNALEVMNEDQMSFDYVINFLSFKSARDKHFQGKYKPPYWKNFDGQGFDKTDIRMSAERIADRFSLFIDDQNLHQFISGKNEFNIGKIAKERKIVCVNFDDFDDEVRAILGCLITHQIKNYYIHGRPGGHPLFVVIDELHLFINELFHRLIVEARKYNLGLILSGHSLRQVSKQFRPVLMNCHTKVCLGVGYEDAKYLANEMRLKDTDVMGLEKYEAYVTIGNETHHVMCYPPPNIESYNPEIPEPQAEVNFLRDEFIPI